MTEEIKTEVKEEKKVCNCKELKLFLLVILASFFGCLVALCIFAAATKPQLPPMPPKMYGPAAVGHFGHGKFKHHKKMKFEKRMKKFGEIPNRPEFKGENFPQDIDIPPVKD